MTGYGHLRESAAWLDLSNRSETIATGEDRARLLHAMTTNDIQHLTEGAGCYVFFLNAQGRILADANVFNLGESLLLDSEPELGGKIREHLDKFIIADDVTLVAEDGRWAIIGIEGPESRDVMQKLGAPIPEVPRGSAAWGEGFATHVSATGAAGFRLFVPPTQMGQFTGQLAAMGIAKADAEAIKTVRLENAKPRYGEDISERYLVQETNQMQAISFTKGCYLGQEIVERVRSRAQVHRVLTPVRIKSKEAPAPGTKLNVEGKDIGEITSAAFSPGLDETVALAYIRVEQAQVKKEMAVSGLASSVTAYIPQ